MDTLLATLHSKFPLCHTIYTLILRRDANSFIMGARLTVKSYKDAEAGANCQIIAVTQCAAYSFPS